MVNFFYDEFFVAAKVTFRKVEDYLACLLILLIEISREGKGPNT